MLGKLQSSGEKKLSCMKGGKKEEQIFSSCTNRSSELLRRLQNKTYSGGGKTEEQLSHNRGGERVKKILFSRSFKDALLAYAHLFIIIYLSLLLS